MTLIAPTLQAFFTDRLVQQRQASPPHHRRLPRHPAAAAQLRAPAQPEVPAAARLGRPGRRTISAFLDHLEAERHNSTRTRNVRLTAIRSLFSYAALRHPEHALLIQRVLAIPPKRFDKRIVTFLTASRSRRAARRPRPGPLGRPARPSPDARWPSRPACGSPSSPA